MPKKQHNRVLLVGETVGPATTGVIYLASYLRRHGIEAYCQWYDGNRTHASLRANVERMLDDVQPTLLGISLKWFPHMARALEICLLAKTHSPDLKVVLGGNTASYYWREFLREPGVDYVIRGDGEVPLLQLCRGEFPVPNLAERAGRGKAMLSEPPFSYMETDTTADVYLSHLDSIFINPGDPALCGSFFIYSGKRCNKKCFYCGGAATAMHGTFGSARPFFRMSDTVRKDLEAARSYTRQFLFDFDFEPADKSQADYFKEIFDAPWLCGHSAYFYFWRMPRSGTLDFLAETFGHLTTTLDLASLSEKHRLRLQSESRLGVKPQPMDDEIIGIFEQAERHDNHTIDVNLICGMPLLEKEDLDVSMAMVTRLTRDFRSLGDIQWGPLHAQPGAPILNHCEEYGMRTLANTYDEFMSFSKLNLRAKEYPDWRHLHYPFILSKDSHILEKTIQHYNDVNAFLGSRRYRGATVRCERRGPVQLL